MKINLKEFKSAFEKVEKGISKEAKTEILKTILVSIETKNNQPVEVSELSDIILKLSTTGLDVYTNVYITNENNINNVDISDSVINSFVIKNPKELKKAMKYFKNDIIEFNVINQEKLEVINGNKKMEIEYLDVSLFPEMKDDKTPVIDNKTKEVKDIKEYIISSQDLLKRILKTKKSISRDAARKELNCFVLQEDFMFTCDSHRIFKSKFDSDVNFDRPILVNKKAIALIENFIDKKDEYEITISENSEYISFKFNNTVISSRIIQGTIIKINEFMSQNNDKEYYANLNTKELLENIKYLKEFYTKEEFLVLNIDNNKIDFTLKTEKSIFNAGQEVLKDSNIKVSEIDNNKFKIGFDIRYFLDVVSQIDNKEVSLYFTAQLSPMMIYDNNETYLTLPVRIID